MTIDKESQISQHIYNLSSKGTMQTQCHQQRNSTPFTKCLKCTKNLQPSSRQRKYLFKEMCLSFNAQVAGFLFILRPTVRGENAACFYKFPPS